VEIRVSSECSLLFLAAASKNQKQVSFRLVGPNPADFLEGKIKLRRRRGRKRKKSKAGFYTGLAFSRGMKRSEYLILLSRVFP
jgi:hypothetical protein